MSGIVIVTLSAVFGAYPVRQLFESYPTHERVAWTGRAIQGALGVVASALFVELFATLLSGFYG